MKSQASGNAECTYTWEQKDQERQLLLNSLGFQMSIDGKEKENYRADPEKFIYTKDGRDEEIPIEKALDQLRRSMQDSFRGPFCTLQIDETGKEVKRQIVPYSGGKTFLDNGILRRPCSATHRTSATRTSGRPTGNFWVLDASSEGTDVQEGARGQGAGNRGRFRHPDRRGNGPTRLAGYYEGRLLQGQGATNLRACNRRVDRGETTIEVSWKSFDKNDPKLSAVAKGTMSLTFEKLPTKK